MQLFCHYKLESSSYRLSSSKPYAFLKLVVPRVNQPFFFPCCLLALLSYVLRVRLLALQNRNGICLFLKPYKMRSTWFHILPNISQPPLGTLWGDLEVSPVEMYITFPGVQAQDIEQMTSKMALQYQKRKQSQFYFFFFFTVKKQTSNVM